MPLVICLFILFPGLVFSQQNEALVLQIDKHVKVIDHMFSNNKLLPDTLMRVEEEYDKQYVVAWYSNKTLKKVRVSNSDGNAGDISSEQEYYFNENKLILMRSGTSYFMAGGCSIIEEAYFNKGDFIRVVVDNDCVGENAETMLQYFGAYSYDVSSNIKQYEFVMKAFEMKRYFPFLMAGFFI